MKKYFTFLSALAALYLNAQFTSPGTGVTYNLTSLATAAPGTVINNGTYFQIAKDVTIKANDKLIIDENTIIKMDKDVTLFIFGEYQSMMDNLVITPTIDGEAYKGIRFEEASIANIKNTTIEKGGGLRVNTTTFVMDNCIVRYNVTGVTSSSAIQFGSGISPMIKNSQFIENNTSALGSGANITVSATIDGNYFYGNNKSNANRPQINMGPGGAAGIKIINNSIIGDRTLTLTGGISASALVGGDNNVTIENNTIKDNRYGITVAGNSSYGKVSKNTIENNNTQNNPSQGGSGINFIGSGTQVMDVKVSENIITGNLWGVTLQGTAQANFGSDEPGKENIGLNVFKNNGNAGATYALFNNTTNNLEAKFNCWRDGELSDDTMVEAVISHNVDDATLGTVNFKPYNCAKLAINEVSHIKNVIYPNPSNGQFTFDTEKAGNIIITDMSGKLVHSDIVKKGQNKLNLNLQSGTYLLLYQSEGAKSSSKILIK